MGKVFTPNVVTHPDAKRVLAGSDAEFDVPGANRVPGPSTERPLPPHTVETILFRNRG